MRVIIPVVAVLFVALLGCKQKPSERARAYIVGSSQDAWLLLIPSGYPSPKNFGLSVIGPEDIPGIGEIYIRFIHSSDEEEELARAKVEMKETGQSAHLLHNVQLRRFAVNPVKGKGSAIGDWAIRPFIERHLTDYSYAVRR